MRSAHLVLRLQEGPALVAHARETGCVRVARWRRRLLFQLATQRPYLASQGALRLRQRKWLNYNQATEMCQATEMTVIIVYTDTT